MATKNQIRAGLRKKRRAGMLPPQECPNERCKANLTDPQVPAEYAMFRDMFSLAREVPIDAKTGIWMCPVCGHSWDRHPWTGTKEEAEMLLRGRN